MEYVYGYLIIGLLWMCLVKLATGFQLKLKEPLIWALFWPFIMWRAFRYAQEAGWDKAKLPREGSDEDPPAAD